MDAVNIVCTGMLDTKGKEIRYLAEQVKKYGGNPILMDLSLAHEMDWADISLSDVLKADGLTLQNAFSLPRSEAVHLVGGAAAKKILELYDNGKVDGIISWAGSVGTSAVTYAMRALPIGVPKMMLCTAASADVSGWLANSDIHIANPISEMGINSITKKTVAPAVAGLIAMAMARKETNREAEESQQAMGAVTLYGTTTKTAAKCAELLQQQHYDVLYAHQTGSGATMEDFIRSGDITAIFDITPGELTNTMFHSAFGIPESWKGKRFTAAFDMGIPCIAAPGGLDQVAYSPPASLPEEILKEFSNGKRVSLRDCGKPYHHSASTVIIPTTIAETEKVANDMMERMNQTKGKTIFFLPMQGWSAYDQSLDHASREMGWSEHCNAPVWFPDENHPSWSKRAVAMWALMERKWNQSNKNLDILKCDMHILDDAFSELLCTAMADILDGRWKKGMYRDKLGVLA